MGSINLFNVSLNALINGNPELSQGGQRSQVVVLGAANLSRRSRLEDRLILFCRVQGLSE